jgi:plastocyanin domain-containing protein
VLLVGMSILGLLTNLTASGGSAVNNMVAGVPSTRYSRPSGPAPVVATLAADGVQTADLVVDGDTFSYQPSTIQVKQGVPVRLNLRTTGRDPGCARLVTIRGLGVRAMATPGQVVPFEFTPQQAGTFEINCGMSMMQPGTLIVTQ